MQESPTCRAAHRHWHYVEVLAAALMRKRRLTGAEVNALFSL